MWKERAQPAEFLPLFHILKWKCRYSRFSTNGKKTKVRYDHLANTDFSTFLHSLLLLRFLYRVLSLYLDTVHNRACTDALEAR